MVSHGEGEGLKEATTSEDNKKKRRASAEPDGTYRQLKKTTNPVIQELENQLGIQGTNSFSTQHNFGRARAVNMANPVFNNIGHDQINHNYHDSNLLWETIKDVEAFHNSEVQVQRGRCLPGTRRAVLRIINDWKVSEIQATPVCWLSGAAGVGKSAIALTVAEEWEKDGLVASFFFFGSDPQRNNASSLILSIAYGLTVCRPHLKALISQRIASDPSILKAKLEYQYDQLVLKSLSLSSAQTSSCNLVIIDGLDDCSDSAAQCRILSIIFSTYQKPLHSALQFLICSRPESWIQNVFKSHKFCHLARHLKLDNSFKPQDDIMLYFQEQFQNIQMDPKYSQIGFPDPWPSPKDLQSLIGMTDGQFTYAAMVMKFVKTEFTLPTNQLHIIIDNKATQIPGSGLIQSPFDELDKLYHIVLCNSSNQNSHLLSVLAAIFLLQGYAPSSPAFIELILQLPMGTVSLALCAMHSVLDIRDWKDSIHVYHTSFTDFLFDSARSREFFIDRSTWKNSLAGHWMRVLSQQCKHNPNLLRWQGKHLNSTGPDQLKIILLQKWNDFCLDLPGHQVSNSLKMEVDHFHYIALSALTEFGYKKLPYVLAAILLLPQNYGLHSPHFIQLLLGIQQEDLTQTLQAILWTKMLRRHHNSYYGESIHSHHTIFTDFLLDKSRSKEFFIDKDNQKNFLAQQSLNALQIVKGHNQGVLLLENWAQICSNVDNPSEGLLFQLYHINLGEVISNIVDGDSEDLSLTMSNLYCLFHDFGNILSWLRLKASGIFLPLLSTQFETVQKGFHIQSTKQDMESGLHNSIVTMVLLSIGNWHGPSSYSVLTRLCDALNYHSKEGRISAENALGSMTFCRCSKTAFLNYEHTTTPVPNAEDVYHVNIQAGYIQILNRCIVDLQSMQDIDEKQNMVDGLLIYSNLLTQCLPQPKLLPIYQTLVAIAMRLERGVDYRRWIALKEPRPKESRDKMLSWLKSFPINYARETEVIKNDILSLFGKEDLPIS